MTTIDFGMLLSPFPPEAVSWRVGSTTGDKTRGLPLAYIDARDVMDRLDEVAGPAYWQCRYPMADDRRTVCEIGILIGSEWVWKADGADDTDYEGVKGGLSDAFKRAAVKWGIGRYLYGLTMPWVSIEAAGRSFKIAEREMVRLRSMLPKPEVQNTAGRPAAAGPEGRKPQAERDIPVKPEHASNPKYAAFIKDTPAGKMWRFVVVKTEARKFIDEMRGVTDESELTGLLEGYGAALDALAFTEPGWWTGMEGFVGVQELISKKRAEIAKARREFHPDNLAAC